MIRPWKSACFLVLSVAIAGVSPAQATAHVPTADELLTLHAAGVPAAELEGILTRNGDPVMTPADLARLEKAGVAAPIVARLRAVAQKAAPKHFEIDDLITLTASGVGEDAILMLVEKADAIPPLTSEKLLDLVRAGVSSRVIKAIRQRAAPPAAAETRASRITLDDLPRLASEGVTTEDMIKRMRDSGSTFDVTADQIIVLSRRGVPKDVLKEVYARRTSVTPPTVPTSTDATPAATTGTGGAATPPKDMAATTRVAPAPASTIGGLHTEDAGGFSVLVPAGFQLHRESKNSNALVSFLSGDPDPVRGLADAELTVFRYRSPTPDRLTEANLPAMADNFLGRLQASYTQRKLTVSFGDRTPARLGGLPALRSRVTTASPDGVTHQGEMWITFAIDQVFVISTAVRSERVGEVGAVLATCLHSFAPSARKARPVGGAGDDARMATLASAWTEAIRNRDFPLYDSLFQAPGEGTTRREQFVALCDRAADPVTHITPGAMSTTDKTLTMRILGVATEQTVVLKLTAAGDSFAILGN